MALPIPRRLAAHEIDGLRFWNGDPTVRLLDSSDDCGAMLLERCEPGTSLRSVPEPEQDLILAHLLRRLWRAPRAPHRFSPLSAMTAFSDLLDMDHERVLLWTFARTAAEPRDNWQDQLPHVEDQGDLKL
jgi:streptomycin 6-kinase